MGNYRRPTSLLRNPRMYVLVVVVLVWILYFHRTSSNSYLAKGKSAGSGTRGSKKSLEFLQVPEAPQYHGQHVPVPWGVSYSPYTANGACKPMQSVIHELKEIRSRGIRTLRLFSSDCQVLECVQAAETGTLSSSSSSRSAAKDQFDIVLGVQPYVTDEQQKHLPQLLASLTTQLDEVAAWGHWDRLRMVVVGSQGVFGDEYTRGDLVQLLRHVRQYLEHTRPVFKGVLTTAEPIQSWVSPTKYNAASVADYRQLRRYFDSHGSTAYNDHGEQVEDTDLCAQVDVVALVAQPVFNAQVAPHAAGDLVARDVRFAQYLCSDDFTGRAHRPGVDIDHDHDHVHTAGADDKVPPVVVLETGWPHHGTPNGDAVPGHDQQLAALQSIATARDTLSNTRIPAVVYSYFDELWRDAGELNVEQSFGISHHFL